jgi:hypothetical protein
MAALAIVTPTGYASANVRTGLGTRLRLRAQWAIPLIGWNLAMLSLSAMSHSPLSMTLAGATLAASAFLAVTEPDDLEE